MLNKLQISKFLYSKGWSRDQVTLAMMHIYSPFHLSILRTKDGKVSQGGHGAGRANLFDWGKITKDARCRVLFAWMFTRILRAGSTSVCDIFHLEEKKLLFYIVNANFEGQMEISDL